MKLDSKSSSSSVKRKWLSTLALLCSMVVPVFNANAIEQSPITDVSVSTYSHINAGNSKNVFELFWNSSSTPISYYEIWLFGDLITTVPGTSYYVEDDIDPYYRNYSIIAVDAQSKRTNPYTIELADDFSIGRWDTVIQGDDIFPYPGVPEGTLFDDFFTTPDVSPDFLDGPIEAPQSFRVEVYSRTAVELFWERVESLSGTVIYEVFRDGDLVYQGDGTSLYLDDMNAQQFYFFEVAAYEEQGFGVSGFSFLDVIISEDGTQNEFEVFDFFDDPFVGGLGGPPENAYGSVYSRSAVEIFWQKPSGWEPKFYEVYRDGGFIGFTEGTSWFEEGLNAGTTYVYEIFAVEPFFGIFSEAPAFVLVTTNE